MRGKVLSRSYSLWLGLAVAAAVAVAIAGQSQRRMPDSPTGRMAGRLIELADARDEAAVDTFLDERVAPDVREGLAPRLRHFRGTVESPQLSGAEKTGAFSATVTLASSGASYRIRYEVEAEEPHRLTAFEWERGASEESGSLPPIPDSATSASSPADVTSGYFAELAASDTFAGSVLVARGDSILHEEAFGLADRDAGRPNRVDTLFDVGSITKLMTKTAKGQLPWRKRLSSG